MNKRFLLGAALALFTGGTLLGALDRAKGDLLLGSFSPLGPTWSLIAFGTQVGSGLTTTTTVTGLTTTGADMIVQCAGWLAGQSTPVFTDSLSNTWTTFDGGIADRPRCAYTATTPTVGSGHNFIQTGPSAAPLIVVALKGSSTATTPPLDQQHGLANSTATTLQAGSITPGQAGELVIAVDSTDNGSPLSIDSGFTNLLIVSFVPSTSLGLGVAFLAQVPSSCGGSPPCATNPTWTNTGSIPASAIIASFKKHP